MKIGGAIFHETRHLDENQLNTHAYACPFCGSENRSSVCVLQENPEVSLLKCVTCGAATASRIPIKEALDRYYEDYYTSPCFAASAERITFDNAQRFGRHLAKKLLKYLKKSSIKILDFGGGDGTIALKTAEQLLNRGVENVSITIVDYNRSLVETDDKRISLTHQYTLDSLSRNGYDFVIASAIIEHIPQPREILISLLDFLDTGGIFYARTPYNVPFIKLFKLLDKDWDFTFPAHMHDLGQDFWEAFFIEIISPNDFSLLESKPSIIETSFKTHFLRTIVALIFKSPWYLLGKRYTLVGGWQVLVRKESKTLISTDP